MKGKKKHNAWDDINPVIWESNMNYIDGTEDIGKKVIKGADKLIKKINKEMELSNLESDRDRLRDKINVIDEKIDELKKKKMLPGLKKKYEGKYFKHRNCYSCPKTDDDYWWIYVRVDKVVDINFHFSGYSFQYDKCGKVEIEMRGYGENDYYFNAFLLDIEITKKEFYEEHRKMMKLISLGGGSK